MINSTQLRLYIDDAVYEGEISSGFSFSNGLVEVTSKPTNGFKEFVTGIKSVTFSFENLLTSISAVLNVGSEYTIKIGPTAYEGFIGQGIIESISIDSSTDAVVKYSGSITLTGELSDFIPLIEDFFLIQQDNDDFILLEDGELLLISIQEN